MKKLNTRGFAILDVVFVIVVILGVVAVGYYIWSHQKQPKSDVVRLQMQAATKQEPVVTVVVEIPELGIQLTVDDSLKDLIFIPGDPAEAHDPSIEVVGFLSTTSLRDQYPSCTTSQGAPLGTIWKVTGQFSTDENQTWLLVKQFPDYFIAYREPAMNCTEEAPFNQQVQANIAVLKYSFDTAAELQ